VKAFIATILKIVFLWGDWGYSEVSCCKDY